MQLKKKSERGSALLITVIIVVMVFGIGGAFLVETIYRSRAQHTAMKADQALMACDAMLEKARLALMQYRFHFENPTDPLAVPALAWSWNDILQYCNSPVNPVSGEVGGTPVPFYAIDPVTFTITYNRENIRNDYLQTQITSGLFNTYRTALVANAPGLNARMSTLDPANPWVPAVSKTTWLPDHAAQGLVLAGNMPYLDGAVYVHVRDNDDEAKITPNPPPNNPLVDVDRHLIVSVIATLQDGTQRYIEALVEYYDPKLGSKPEAAVTTNSYTETTGSIIVDGNDYSMNLDATGNPVLLGPGVLGIASDAQINMTGASTVGGNGQAPVGSEMQGTTTSESHLFPAGFPAGPDEALGIPPGTLKKAAQKQGTYFTSMAQYDAYISANGGSMPEGKILFIEPSGPLIGSFSLSDNNAPMNGKPSILVIHNPTTTGEIAQVHGNFKGILLADQITRINAGTKVLGGVFTFSDSIAGNQFGNGNSNIWFSSEVWGNLPRIADITVRVKSWRRIV